MTMTAYSLIPTAEINTGIRAHVSVSEAAALDAALDADDTVIQYEAEPVASAVTDAPRDTVTINDIYGDRVVVKDATTGARRILGVIAQEIDAGRASEWVPLHLDTAAVATLRDALTAWLDAPRDEAPDRPLDLDGGPTDPAFARAKLEAERATLIARLAEIDAALAGY